MKKNLNVLECFTNYFLTNTVIHACLNITEKQCGPQIWLCLFIFRFISFKELNNLTSIDTFPCLGGLEVTHQIVVRDVPCSIPGSCKINDFHVCFLLLYFYICVHNILFAVYICYSLCHVNSLCILNIWQSLGPI